MSLLDRVRALLGDDAVEIAGGPDAVPRVAPPSPDAVALLLGTARQEGWRVRLEGAGGQEVDPQLRLLARQHVGPHALRAQAGDPDALVAVHDREPLEE